MAEKPDTIDDVVAAINSGDQSEAAFTALAATFGMYFNALCHEGLTRQEALAVVISWQAEAIRRGGSA